jgi:hypothetical protein
MLVPVQGGVAALQKRNRTIHEQEAALATIDLPMVYIFNVGLREWRGVGGGKEWVIPACPKGARHSEPVAIPTLCISERDLADGGNNLDTIMDAALSGSRKIGKEVKHVMGVADDIIGKNSTAAGLDLHTTNGEWFGVFVTPNEEPEEEQLDAADAKLREMMQLVYQTGADKVAAGERVSMPDRKRYNEAAIHLGTPPLWGKLDHTMAECPECGEDIRKGAKVCKHCQLAIDPASVEARRKKRQKDAAKMEKEAEQQEVGE